MKKIISTVLCLASLLFIICFTGCESSLLEKEEKHSFGEWYVSVEATCENKGEEKRECKNCKHYEVREVKELGHEIVLVEAKEPTHLEVGYEAHEKCNRCEYSTLKEVIEKIAHEFTETVIEPTCSSKGYTEYSCECGYVYQDNFVDEIEHDYLDYEIITEETCLENGLKSRKCNVCDFVEEVEIPARGHLYKTEIIEPTCTEDGVIIYKCECGDVFNIVIPKKDHIGENQCDICGEAILKDE